MSPTISNWLAEGFSEFRKAKGRFLFRDFAPFFPIFRRSVSAPDHNYSSLQNCLGPASGARRFPYTPVIPFAVRAFLFHPVAASFLSASRVPLPVLEESVPVCRRAPLPVPLRIPFPVS